METIEDFKVRTGGHERLRLGFSLAVTGPDALPRIIFAPHSASAPSALS